MATRLNPKYYIVISLDIKLTVNRRNMMFLQARQFGTLLFRPLRPSDTEYARFHRGGVTVTDNSTPE